MDWAAYDTSFLQAMVQSMYRYEAAQVNAPDLLTDAEMRDFYCSFCCI